MDPYDEKFQNIYNRRLIIIYAIEERREKEWNLMPIHRFFSTIALNNFDRGYNEKDQFNLTVLCSICLSYSKLRDMCDFIEEKVVPDDDDVDPGSRKIEIDTLSIELLEKSGDITDKSQNLEPNPKLLLKSSPKIAESVTHLKSNWEDMFISLQHLRALSGRA
ncbi:hypothetical protein RCL_jg13962.t1 [Rhizophagus clarus]|uniref:Uncharacterized protein n=1 Tax=Rhizophagus clarus TaxID=94130 RepID=A0A8H3LN58_9GLOM|nr:hypothetical protein RCL_jg13962.t1 [Rhizophagus clarus]